MKIEFLIFELDNQKYGIEVKYVQQILRHSVKEDESNLIDLRKIFGLDSSSAGQSVRLTYKGRTFRIRTDAVYEIRSFDKSEVDRIKKNNYIDKLFYSAIQTDDGIIVNLDIEELLNTLS